MEGHLIQKNSKQKQLILKATSMRLIITAFIFKNLKSDTLYAYRVGDGANWTEYYHFKTASSKEKPFSFIYFGDAQNEVKTHWSRVFREAFRDAPRAAFTLHAGDLVDVMIWTHNGESGIKGLTG